MTVAVYGTLRKEGSNHPLLATGQYRGSFYSEPIYAMKSLSGNHYPGIKEGGKTSVLFEVYRIEKKDLEALDNLEGYYGKDSKHNLYNRKIIDTPYGKAIIYLYNNDFNIANPLITTGDWIEFKKNLILKQYAC